MSAQYDAIATGYQRTKTSPVRRYVETFSFLQMLGDLGGLQVLDLACGEGFYSRLIARAGAAAVTGVDISAEMIALAEAEEAAAPLGVRYRCADVAAWQPAQKYDLVSAAYLLHYAPDESALRAMCRNVAAALPAGGRFVAINENPDQPADFYAGYTQYGFNKRFATPRTEGSPIEYAMVAGREMIRFEVRYYSREVYEAALTAAGFRNIRWIPLQLDPAAHGDPGAGYFEEYLRNPPAVGLEACL